MFCADRKITHRSHIQCVCVWAFGKKKSYVRVQNTAHDQLNNFENINHLPDPPEIFRTPGVSCSKVVNANSGLKFNLLF